MLKTSFRHLVARRLERQVKRLISEKHLTVVAITGNVGKTSTKLAIATILKQKHKVLAHAGNYNSEIGLPLSIFELDVPSQLANPIAWVKIFRQIDRKISSFPYDVLVLELGADMPGDIQKFMRYLRPDIGVITAIGDIPVHLEQFKTAEAVLNEKFYLALGSDFVLLNADDPRLMSRATELGDRVETFGTKGKYHFSHHDLTPMHGNGRLVLAPNASELDVELNIVAEHGLYAISSAAGVADHLGLSTTQIAAGVANIKPYKGRMNPLPGLNGSTILDDTYNASPAAVLAALTTLKQCRGRKIAILGSMNELGDGAEKAHRAVGDACAGVDWLITIGENASQYIAPAAIAAGVLEAQVKVCMSPYEAGHFVQNILVPGSTVLAKGSQNQVFAEEAVKLLLASPSDQSQLVRQSEHWLETKRRQFPDAPSSLIGKARTRPIVRINLPKPLLRNNVELTEKHLQEVKLETEIERQWYAEVNPFGTLASILAAVVTKRLAKVEPSYNYAPILRFRNPELIGTYPPYVTAEAKLLLEEVTTRWRNKCDADKIPSEVRLAVTALVMTTAYRDELLKAGKLAIDKGPHVLGEAFDIDGCGYYLGDAPINPRQNTQATFAEAFGNMKAKIAAPKFQDYKLYDVRVHDNLRTVLMEMLAEEKLHYVEEYPGTTNTSFHICRNPKYRG